MNQGRLQHRDMLLNRLQRAALVLCLGLSASCSLALGWSPDRLACDTNVINGMTDFCLAGFSCLTSTLQCVADGTLPLGHACTAKRQCLTGEVCPYDALSGGGVQGHGGVQLCARGCQSSSAGAGYFGAASCPTGEACLPFLDASVNNANKALMAACVAGASCTAGDSCASDVVPSGGVCVPISTTAQACLSGCEISWSATQTYSDNCDSSHTCQPVGLVGQQQFACMYNAQNNTTNPLASIKGQAVQPRGAPCSLVERPCAKGDVCSPQGSCAAYCQVTANQAFPCPSGQSCCPLTTFATSQTTGFCAASCQ